MIAHRHRLPLALLVVSGCLFVATVPASGQQVVPNDLKTSPNAETRRAEIDTFVTQQVAKISADDKSGSAAAGRNALAKEAEGQGIVATPSYQEQYAAAVNKALLPLAQHKKLSVRLNAAIAAANVARKVENAQLAPAASAFMKDSSEAVVLWGVKIAHGVLPALAQQNPKSPLFGEIVAVVKAHPTSGFIAEEAYNALSLDNQNIKGQAVNVVAKVYLSPLFDLLKFRTSQYADGTPPSPLAEKPITLFFPLRAWPVIAADAALQKQTLQTTGDLVCAAMNALANPPADASVEDMVQLVRNAGAMFGVFGERLNNNPLRDAGRVISAVGSSTAPAVLNSNCSTLGAALSPLGITLKTNPGEASTAGQDTSK